MNAKSKLFRIFVFIIAIACALQINVLAAIEEEHGPLFPDMDVMPSNSKINYNEVYNQEFPASTNKILGVLEKKLGKKASFYAYTWNRMLTIGYNQSDVIKDLGTINYLAFAVKLYADIYLEKMTGEEEVEYTTKYYTKKATGLFKSVKVGSKFTVNQLLSEMIRKSSNLAYQILYDKYNEEYISFMSSILGKELKVSKNDYIVNLSTQNLATLVDKIVYFQDEIYATLLSDLAEVKSNLNLYTKGEKVSTFSYAHNGGIVSVYMPHKFKYTLCVYVKEKDAKKASQLNDTIITEIDKVIRVYNSHLSK